MAMESELAPGGGEVSLEMSHNDMHEHHWCPALFGDFAIVAAGAVLPYTCLLIHIKDPCSFPTKLLPRHK